MSCRDGFNQLRWILEYVTGSYDIVNGEDRIAFIYRFRWAYTTASWECMHTNFFFVCDLEIILIDGLRPWTDEPQPRIGPVRTLQRISSPKLYLVCWVVRIKKIMKNQKSWFWISLAFPKSLKIGLDFFGSVRISVMARPSTVYEYRGLRTYIEGI